MTGIQALTLNDGFSSSYSIRRIVVASFDSVVQVVFAMRAISRLCKHLSLDGEYVSKPGKTRPFCRSRLHLYVHV
jgi:hypothetical protein